MHDGNDYGCGRYWYWYRYWYLILASLKISVLPLLNYANNILYNILHKARIERDSQNCMHDKFQVFENLALVDEFAGLRNFQHF